MGRNFDQIDIVFMSLIGLYLFVLALLCIFIIYRILKKDEPENVESKEGSSFEVKKLEEEIQTTTEIPIIENKKPMETNKKKKVTDIKPVSEGNQPIEDKKAKETNKKKKVVDIKPALEDKQPNKQDSVIIKKKRRQKKKKKSVSILSNKSNDKLGLINKDKLKNNVPKKNNSTANNNGYKKATKKKATPRKKKNNTNKKSSKK